MVTLSDLQERILAELARQPAETQAELASRAGTQQPSISRSLRPLLSSGLIVKDKRGRYKVTPAGQAMLRSRQEVERVGAQLENLIDESALAQIQATAQQLSTQIVKLQTDLTGFDKMRNQIQDLTKSVALEQGVIDQITRTQEQVRTRLIEPFGDISRILEDSAVRMPIPPVFTRVSLVDTAQFDQAIQASRAIGEALQSSALRSGAFQQEIRNATEGLDTVTRALTADFSFVEELRRTFDLLEIFRPLLEAIEEERSAAEAFRVAGWPIAPSMPGSLIRRVVALHKEGKAGYASQTIMGYYRRNDHKHLVEMVEEWRNRPHFGQERMDIIVDALWAHCQGRYTLSVPALVLQIEGIMSEYVIANGLPARLGKPRQVYEAVVGDPLEYGFSVWAIAETLLYQLRENIYHYIPFEEELSRPVHRRHTNRHTISHGITPGYNQENHSLRAFLLLDALAILPQFDFEEQDRTP